MKDSKKRFKSSVLKKAIYDENQAKQSARLDKMTVEYSICTDDPDRAVDVDFYNKKAKDNKIRYE